MGNLSKISNFTGKSLRFFRPSGQASKKKRFSEAYFCCNLLNFTYLTPKIFVEIFPLLVKSSAKT